MFFWQGIQWPKLLASVWQAGSLPHVWLRPYCDPMGGSRLNATFVHESKRDMSFQIECPNCGRRPVSELHHAGSVQTRPDPTAGAEEWTDYLYNKPNIRGMQIEWWYHRSGCKLWFIAERDTRTNEVLTTRRYEPREEAGVNE